MNGFLQFLVILSWRNLFRNKRRTALIVAMISSGLAGVLLLSTIARGFSSRAVNSAVESFLGHIQVHAPAYLDDPVAVHSLPAAEWSAISREAGGSARISARVRVPAVVMSEYETRGAALLGIDPQEERDTTFFGSMKVDGAGLSGADSEGIVIGRKLAAELQTGLGKRVVVSATDRNNTVVERGFVIVGVFNIDPESREAGFMFIGRDTAQRMLSLGGDISELALTLSAEGASYDSDGVELSAAALRTGHPGVEVLPWFKIEPLSHVIRTVQDGIIRFMFTVVIGSIGFGLVNSLLMAVHERRRELALLLALGMSPISIVLQIIVETAMTLLAGAVLGNLISYSLYTWVRPGIDLGNFAAGVSKFGVGKMIYPQFVYGDWLSANVIMGIVVLLSCLYPAYRAVSYVPVEALRK